MVLFRRTPSLEVLLGHMGGPYWARKDKGAWSIPKGAIEKGEEPLAAAIREFEEEIGPLPTGDPFELGVAIQKSGKKVFAWAQEGEFDVTLHKSNLFELEWPPNSGKVQQFPELDRVEWMPIEQACARAIEAQAALFKELERKILGSA